MSMPCARRGYASTAVLVRFVACLLPIRCRFVLSMCQSQIPIVRFNVLPFIGLQVPSTTNCQVSPSIVNDSDQLKTISPWGYLDSLRSAYGGSLQPPGQSDLKHAGGMRPSR